jgi:hypothetical protein
MPIPAQNPTTVPAVPEKSFSDLWLYNINIHAPAVNSGRIYIEALPYNPDVQEIGPSSGLEVISTDQLFQAAYDVPEVGIAYQAIIDAIVPLREWIAAQNAPQPPPVIEVVQKWFQKCFQKSFLKFQQKCFQRKFQQKSSQKKLFQKCH